MILAIVVWYVFGLSFSVIEQIRLQNCGVKFKPQHIVSILTWALLGPILALEHL